MVRTFCSNGRCRVRFLACLLILTNMICAPAAAADPGAENDFTAEDLRRLAEALEEQKKKLASQEQALIEQQRVIAEQQDRLNALALRLHMPQDTMLTPVAYNLGRSARPGDAPAAVQPVQEGRAPATVGTAPDEERPEVAIIAERGGVLTRRGQLVLEPQIEYANTSSNRFFFQGFEVVDTVLIGLIEATDADRDTFQAALGARLGVTDRFEVELRAPYLYRDDRVENTLLSVVGQPTLTRTSTANGIGDIEAAAHYQLNDGRDGWPYFVGNLRVKSDTGKGPYDVEFDENGVATEPATGSGFWGVQPSVTAIFPTDPAVFFGNLGYTWNIKRDVDETIAGNEIGEVDPGDSINTSFGMGIGLNERTSFSFGFEFNYVFETTEKRESVEIESDKLKIGSLLLGWSYQVNDRVGLNLNTGFGVTEDATDFRASLRVPISFDLF